MDKLNPIKYIENMLSHHPKSISLWITEGIVINGERYIIKEFRLRDGSLYAVIAENKYTPKYFEVKLAPDEETLKDIYQAIKENKIAIEKEVTDRKNEIARVDTAIKANTTKIEQEVADRKSEITRVDKAIEANTAKIDKEISDRTNEITRVDEAINANTAKINQEITDRQNEITRVDNAINANTAKIDKEIQDRQNEINRVEGKLTELQGSIKPIVSDNSGLLTVTNENSQIKLTPKHDGDKAQVLNSPTGTINVVNGANGTNQKTAVEVNPEKVLEHDNLLTDNGISKITSGNTTKLGLEYRLVDGGRFDLNNLVNGKVKASDFVNAPKENTWYFVSSYAEGNYTIQEAITLVDSKNITYRRTKQNGVWGPWREQAGDKSVIDSAISANTKKINQEITDRKNEITRVEGKIPTEIGGTNHYAISKDSKTGISSYLSDVKRDVTTGIISAKITGVYPYFGAAIGVGRTYQETYGQKIPVIQGKSIAVTFSNSLFNKNYVSYFGSDDVAVKGYSNKGASRFIVPASDLVGVSYITLRYGLANGTDYVGQTIETKVKVEYDSVYTDWSPAPEDVVALIAQKQDKLTAGTGIAIQGNVISATGDSAPQHDTQKEQVLASTQNTITITHGTNGTSETTKVDTNPEKVLEHDNLINEFGISKTKSGNITKLGVLYTAVPNNFDLNTLYDGRVRAGSFVNAPRDNTWFFVSSFAIPISSKS